MNATVDLCYDDENEQLETVIADLESKYSIQIAVIQPVGPGGGWPEVRLTGSTEQVTRALNEAWGFYGEEVGIVTD